MDEYPSNSFKSKESKQEENQVVDLKKKETISEKFRKTFNTADSSEVKEYLFRFVVVPKLKEFFSTFVNSGVSFWLNSPKSGGSVKGSEQAEIYHSASGTTSKSPDSGDKAFIPTNTIYRYKDYGFTTYEKADEVLGGLRNYLEKYTYVELARFLEECGAGTKAIDFKYGWRNLDNVSIKFNGDAWFIDFPKISAL